MANVLGELFSDLAESIRGGLGDIGTMKPKVFPDRVDEIVALLEHYKNNGGNSGDSSIPTKVETGTFTASSTGVGRVYVNHSLGETPDFIAIWLSKREGILNTDKNPIISAWSVKDNIYPYVIKGGLNGTNTNIMATTGHDVFLNDEYMARVFSYIKALNKTTFYVGSDLTFENNANQGFVPNARYSWIAVSGLKNVAVEPLVVSENGTYAPTDGVYGYSPVVVNVPVNDPVLQPLEITENGTYTAPAGVDGYNPVTVNVDPTKVTILREQQFDGFVLDSTFGAYSPGFVTPAQFVLKDGETYHVVWDGTEYECTAIAFDYSGMTMVAIGNGSSLGLPGNGEPFLITYNAGYDNTQLFSTDTKSSHTVGIWQEVKTEIKLQDKTITENGEYTADIGFDGLGKVTVGVAGSGGGSLPPGGYWQEDELGMPSGGYAKSLFMHNGVLHCVVNTAYSNPITCDLYRVENGSWVKIGTSLDVSSINRIYICNTEYNGKVFFSGYLKGICVYNGDGTFTKLSDLPDSVGDTVFKTFVQDGKLKYLSYSLGNVYVWDESTDTWTIEASSVIGANKDYCNVFNANGTIYVTVLNYSKSILSIYKYESQTLTHLRDTNAQFLVKTNTVFDGRYVYGEGYDSEKKYTGLMKLNLETGEVTILCRMPWLYSSMLLSPRLYATDCVRLFGVANYNATTMARYNLILHEVTE